MKLTCSCGKEFWPGQRWLYDKCMASHPVVVNAENSESLVVNARTKDRHRKTPERAAYIAKKMREYRKRAASPRD
jgi:hypothetical protein